MESHIFEYQAGGGSQVGLLMRWAAGLPADLRWIHEVKTEEVARTRSTPAEADGHDPRTKQLDLDGAAALTAASAAAAFTLASAGGQSGVATAASALVGACLGFFLYNRRPTRVDMGDAPSLVLTFLVAAVAIQVDQPESALRRWLVPAMLLGVRMLDTMTISVARWWNGRPVYVAAQDHLSHRLVVLGRTQADAVLTLAGCQGLLGGVAVLVGWDFMSLWTGLLINGGVLGGLLLICKKATMYEDLDGTQGCSQSD